MQQAPRCHCSDRGFPIRRCAPASRPDRSPLAARRSRSPFPVPVICFSFLVFVFRLTSLLAVALPLLWLFHRRGASRAPQWIGGSRPTGPRAACWAPAPDPRGAEGTGGRSPAARDRPCFLLASFSLHEQRKVARSLRGSESLAVVVVVAVLLLFVINHQGESSESRTSKCQSRSKGFRTRCAGRESLLFARAKRSNQEKTRPDASRCDETAPVPCAPRRTGAGAQLAALRHVRLFAPALLRGSACFTALGSKQKQLQLQLPRQRQRQQQRQQQQQQQQQQQ
jgi:hypothetical protein